METLKENNIPQKLLDRILRYCNYQERSEYEVKQKLKSWAVNPETTGKIITRLREQNILNDERFAKLYAKSKLHHNRWGKNKIIYALRQKNIPNIYIEKAVEEIRPEEWEDMLTQILKKKNGSLKEEDLYKRKQKLYAYAASKGYEHTLILSAIEKIVNENI